jgi:hypothetical protein
VDSGQLAVGSGRWAVNCGQWAVEKSMKLLPSDVHRNHNRTKHHSSDCSKNNMSPDFVLERHQNFIMSEVLSTQFRNKKSFEKKEILSS